MITSTRKTLVRAASLALFATTALLHLGTSASHAAPAASQSYTTSAYSLRYPAGWSPINSGSPTTFTLFTDDRNAFVAVSVQPATNVGSNPMPQAFVKVLGQSGTEVARPQYGTSNLHGIRVLWASGVVRYGNNAHVGVLTLYLATYRSHTYMAALGVVDSGDNASSIGGQEYQQGAAILSTITFR